MSPGGHERDLIMKRTCAGNNLTGPFVRRAQPRPAAVYLRSSAFIGG